LDLVAAGLVLAVGYTVAVWYGIYANDTAEQVCGRGIPHRDNFFPPYTSCGSGPRFRITSSTAEFAGAGLFVLAMTILIGGVAVLIAGRYRDRPARPAVAVDPAHEGPPSS
jgi:hypothetical protein